ncbi:hypothetical protein EC968_004723 [Mortierella alpina]|nr:hypothetical protein EC968_004723 [Mortierella alpina]
MARDIEFRITSLVVSRCGGTETDSGYPGARLSAVSHESSMELRLGHTEREIISAPDVLDQENPGNEMTEKARTDAQNSALHHREPKRLNNHQLDFSQGVNSNEESTGIDLYAVSGAAPLACNSLKDEDVAAMPQQQHYASLYGDEYGKRSGVPSIGIRTPQVLPLTTIPSQRSAPINESTGASDYAMRLPYGNRMATLSFYDDLLANISSERMNYTTSLSNQSNSALLQLYHSTEQGAKMDGNSSVLSLRSSPLCSSMQLTYGSNNENDERSMSGRPVHPFDSSDLPQTSPTLLKEDHPDTSIDNPLYQQSDTLATSFGSQMGLSSRIYSTENSQDQSAYATAHKSQSRSGSSHSQNIIENWRIHVAPSPPTIPDLYNDARDTVTDRATALSGDQNEYSSQDIGMDINTHNSTGCADRRGTIPIILSSHLQDARTANFVEEQYFFSAEDLEAPRPPYAYSQTRARRQGSVNSSTGGYNYSTAASSPSLADSLSNPMYQQQSFGIMNSSTMLQPRPPAPRKGSLPTSLCSRPVMEDLRPMSGASQFPSQHQPSDGFASAIPSRLRSNMPSQLSNMITHSGNTADYAQGIGCISTPVNGEQVQIPLRHQRGHFRSQSQGARSSGSSWDQVGFEDAKAGYTTLIDIPAITPLHMGYYSVQDDMVASKPALRSSGIMGLKEESMLNDGSVNFSRDTFGPWSSGGESPQSSSNNGYRDDMSDNMVHPLDLPPLTLQTHSGSQREFNPSDAVTSIGSASHQDQAWDDTCVGLGLTFDLDHSSLPGSSDNEGSIFIHHPHERLVMASSMTSGFLTHTGHSYHSEPYTNMDMSAATNNLFDAASMNSFRSPSPVDNVNIMRDTAPHHDDYSSVISTKTIYPSPATESNHGRPPLVQRQSSQRNKKNLIVNIVPL